MNRVVSQFSQRTGKPENSTTNNRYVETGIKYPQEQKKMRLGNSGSRMQACNSHYLKREREREIILEKTMVNHGTPTLESDLLLTNTAKS